MTLLVSIPPAAPLGGGMRPPLCRGDLGGCDGFWPAQGNDLHNRVVVRHATRIEPAGGNDHIHFRPVALYAPRLDTADPHAPAVFAAIISQQNWVSVLQAQPLRIFLRHD